MILADTEKRVALIHRVLVPDNEYPKEYVILVTDKRSVFIRQPKTRRTFILRGEMKYGTALVTDVALKSLSDYEQTSLETLTSDRQNIAIPHQGVVSFAMKADKLKFRLLDFWQWFTMRMQKEIFQVYNFQMEYHIGSEAETGLKFYAVPLGEYFKPRRQTQTRETILREYATDIFEIYLRVLPRSIMSGKEQAR